MSSCGSLLPSLWASPAASQPLPLLWVAAFLGGGEEGERRFSIPTPSMHEPKRAVKKSGTH